MFQILAFITGALITAAIPLNGTVAAYTGIYSSTIVIYILSVLCCLLWLRWKKQPLFPREKLPWLTYMGGVFGVGTSVMNNYAFGKISTLAIIALCLLSQTLCSLVIDTRGWFGVRRKKANAGTLLCVLLSLGGVVVMLRGAELHSVPALGLAFCTGVTVVLSRILSADLARSAGPVGSSCICYMMGIPAVTLAMLLIGRGDLLSFHPMLVPAWAWLTAPLGILMVVLSNIILQKISAFQMALLTFLGQIFSGAAVDYLMHRGPDLRTLLGGGLVACGILVNTLWELRRKKPEKT